MYQALFSEEYIYLYIYIYFNLIFHYYSGVPGIIFPLFHSFICIFRNRRTPFPLTKCFFAVCYFCALCLPLSDAGSGGDAGADPSGGALRPGQGLPVHDLRHLVDRGQAARVRADGVCSFALIRFFHRSTSTAPSVRADSSSCIES